MHCMLLVVINCQLFHETLSALMALNAFLNWRHWKVTEYIVKTHKLNQLKVHFCLSITLADA